MSDMIAALTAALPTQEMGDLVTEILVASLTSLGLFRNGIQKIADLHLPKQPPSFYERWLTSSILYLQQQGALAGDMTISREVRTLAELWTLWENRRSAWTVNGSQQAQSALLEVCLKALPEILTGKQRATDVMFPNSSMKLVEGVYRDNAQANYFNSVLAELLGASIEQQLQQDESRKIRILEIGAGTGGTTASLLPILQRYPVEEYGYTDVSKAFLMHGEKHFRAQFTPLTTSVFDVSRPLASQGIAGNHYDFAIAANVLHATPNIRETLRNAKAVLKNQGVLLLNEISTWSLFNHLTFGLLEGWWLCEDTAVRLPGSPGVAPEKWREILAEEGFESILFPAEEAHQFGQQIIAAVSNGWIRQRTERHLSSPRSEVMGRTAARKSEAVEEAQTAKSSEPSGELIAKMSFDHTRRIITENLSEALRMDAAMIRDDASFADYGVDSIVGVNLVRTIADALGVELETTSLFEYSTVDQLTEYIVKTWPDQVASRLVRPQGMRNESGRPTEPTKDACEASAASDFMVKNRFSNGPEAADVRVGNDCHNTTAEPIAIVGMSGRFAESESLDEFWQHLAAGKDLVKGVSRWSPRDCVLSEPTGNSHCAHGSFVDSIDQFDPAFFGISAEEATYMDPQQRLFLEESWKALEDAGYAGKSVHEKQCGVYAGCGSSRYDRLIGAVTPPQAFWGNSQAVTPARIAYCLNLQGPAIAVDTACSSSLVAIHLACQGLWSRETEMALAGGVFLQPTPGFYQVANRAGMLSPDGKCYSFDARANGFVPGEGVGVVVLKRLRDALADRDHIHGVIAASGINQDGRSNGLIAPNGRAQERLERSVYDRFQINPETIQLVEAHGTGTLLGDSIEYGALSRAFREYTDKKQFCALGTVKTNIGHTSTAAGVAGVLKVLAAIKNRLIPPSLNFEKGNPAIDFESGPFYVNSQLREWAVEGNERRRAAISSFGFSGTNAHVIIEEAPSIERVSVESPAYLIVLSTQTAEQLKQHTFNLFEYLQRTPNLSMIDLSFSFLVGRKHMSHRLACLAHNQNELISLLGQWLEAGLASHIYTAEAPEGKIREQVSLKKFGNYCIQQCQTATNSASYMENLAAIAELYVQGYALDFPDLFPVGARRTPLPTYPFAKQRYWVDSGAGKASPQLPTINAAARAPQQTHLSNPSRPSSGTLTSLDGDLRSWLQTELSRIVAGLLNIGNGDVAPDKILLDLGFDSIGLTNFANAINQRFELDVTPVLFFDYPSVAEIAKYLSVERQTNIRRAYRDSAATSHNAEMMSPLQQTENTMRKNIPALPSEFRTLNEPVAIIGIAGVMPQADDLEELWANLRDAKDVVTVIPEDRWKWEDYFGDPLKEKNKSNSRWGGFMKQVDQFDPLFFGISPREAQMMDPQQRIFLEIVWKAIEDSGHKVSDLSSTRTGVFVGVGSNDYLDIMRGLPIVLDGYTASGNSHSVLANRVSFLLNLRGPSSPIDTACSSSLVALHRAVESIHTKSCDMAIVGGVQVILSPGAYISFGMAGMLSSDGRCKAFDKRANGYVRGEGCAAMLLKPLSMAERDGDHVYAVIKATSENHGGRVTTMTAPNSSAQAELLIEAYKKAQIDPATVGYIECHGTGTSLGDPIEIQALIKAFRELNTRYNRVPVETPRCGLGTIKTNIGHLETAAGIAGVVKVLLALEHKQIPAILHFEEINPYINLSGTPFYIVDKLTPWEAPTNEDGTPLPRRAGVSSFGFGGANAHAVLEEYVSPQPRSPAAVTEPQVIILSAKNEDRLRAYIQATHAYVGTHEVELADLAYTLQIGRDEMPERFAVVVSSIGELKAKLKRILQEDELPPDSYRHNINNSKPEDKKAEVEEQTASIQSLVERKELSKLAERWVSGIQIDWVALHSPRVPKRISVPTYPFARERYWVSGAAGTTPSDSSRRLNKESKESLRSFVPVWNVRRFEANKQSVPQDSAKILLLGAGPAQLDWLQHSYPNAESVEINPTSAIEAIQSKLADRYFEELVWVAPDVIADPGEDCRANDDITQQQEEGVVALFRIVKALLSMGHDSRRLQWTIITRQTQPVTTDEPVRPAHAGISGFIGSLAKECPGWHLRLLDVDSLRLLSAKECLSLAWDKQGNTWARRRGEWFQNELVPIESPTKARPAYRQKGVYVVIGGAGGIGEVWTRFMVEHYQAQVIWIGRRPCDAAIESKIAALAKSGPAPLYISADATDPEALGEARRTILESHHAIHGVVHSALVLKDRSISRMDESSFRAGLSAKVDISVNIDRVFGDQKLDFILFFSSIASFVKSAGQSNYSAGCAFKDSFAQMLNRQRRYPVKVMNWGYWGTVGVAADDLHRQNMAQMGLGSIEPQEGMLALESLMSSEMPQLALIKTVEVRRRPATRLAGVDYTHAKPAAGTLSPPTGPTKLTITDHVRQTIIEMLCDELRIEAAVVRHDRPLSDYGVDSIIGVNLVRKINEALQIQLEPAILFEYSDVNRLTDYVLGTWQQQIADEVARERNSPGAHQTPDESPFDTFGDRPVTPQNSVNYKSQLHPLLHTNTSTLSQHSYSATFTGNEFFLNSQLAGGGPGRRVLPEVACLEMARAAIEMATGNPADSAIVTLHETTWAKAPLIHPESQVTIALLARDNGQMAYEVYSGEGAESIVHCQGRITMSARHALPTVNLDELRKQMCHPEMAGDEVYGTFEKAGRRYGPAFQTITAVYPGDRQLLARLSSSATETTLVKSQWNQGYSLHPSMMTGAVQAGMKLIGDGAAGAAMRISVRTLEYLSVQSPCQPEMFAWARHSNEERADENPSAVDIDLFDLDGNVCAQIRGLSFQLEILNPQETIEGFLKQEAALQLQKSFDEIGVDRSYFDLGFSSITITKFIGALNALLDVNLSPSVLFDHRDIGSLAASVAAKYPAKVKDLNGVRGQGFDDFGPQTALTRLPRKTWFGVRPFEVCNMETAANMPAREVSSEQVLEMVMWQEESLDDSYEKVTF